MAVEDKTPILELKGVSKHFAGVVAVRDVSLRVHSDEVLCLLGDNGAGKSTLIKILSGVYQPTGGTIAVDGNVLKLSSPRVAKSYGIATVHQEVGVIELMSVTRNFVLGAEPLRGWGPFKWLDSRGASAMALERVQEVGIRRVEDCRQLGGTLSGGERQALSIARALHLGARVLILDEPTSALGVREARTVLRLIAQARAKGVGVIFITHNANHALAIGDRFTVLIHGRVAADLRRGEATRDEILNLMAGGEELEALAEEVDTDVG
ncbi:MAG TPA: ATP-binding cassette domain-containing protein [Acidothermaceae bacterium]|jgi:simple sugar transport system ATP-binding protein|nr:ATP-binding cassette domain-containing protein [Acidothermaceae bacterium]